MQPKPAPDLYATVVKKLKVLPQDAIAIEDTETGVAAAKAAGLKAIAVPNKYTKGQDFSKADIIVESLSDITLDLLIGIITDSGQAPIESGSRQVGARMTVRETFQTSYYRLRCILS